MMRRIAPKILVPLAISMVAGTAGAACNQVAGTVRLLPDATCQIAAKVPGHTYIGSCFSVQLSLIGLPGASGYAGVTAEPLIGANGVGTVAPAVVPSDFSPVVPRQIVQTARSAITIGKGSNQTTLYTTDVMVVQPTFDATTGQMGNPAALSEQILITGSDNKGAYAKVTGNLTIIGNSIGQSVPVLGKLCLP
ncbi:MAG: hypothetical protein JSR83_12000 [Proteobacteria bacterium]|nr:hypothetical protein [Pseudomonadota bacterium]